MAERQAEKKNMTEGLAGAEKQEIRARIKRLRKNLDPDLKKELDQAILLKLLDLPEFWTGAVHPVFCYVSIGGEVDTLAFIRALWQRRIPVAVPRVEGAEIIFYQISRMEDLKPGCMGIPEPVEGCVRISDRLGPVITPGLAFTEDGKRIGYGGGYYDRFFEEQPEHERIAAAYPFQILSALPTEPQDMQVDRIVSSDRICHCAENRAK